MRTARLAARLRRLEAVAGAGGPHEHSVKLYLLGGPGSYPPEGWLDTFRYCAGCEHPEWPRMAVWPDSARTRLLGEDGV